MKLKNNEQVEMTRRIPNLKQSVLRRDSEIAKKLIHAWDIEGDESKVYELFKKESKNLSDERFWETLRTIWVVAGSLKRIGQFRSWFTSNRKERYYFSTPEEQKRLREMPENFVVFRACNDEDDGGISWTIWEEYAYRYKEDYSKSKVISKIVNKKQVFALIERNIEEEIIIL